jgi:hypothetical protein
LQHQEPIIAHQKRIMRRESSRMECSFGISVCNT